MKQNLLDIQIEGDIDQFEIIDLIKKLQKTGHSIRIKIKGVITI